jgi:hypothetical protein
MGFTLGLKTKSLPKGAVSEYVKGMGEEMVSLQISTFPLPMETDEFGVPRREQPWGCWGSEYACMEISFIRLPC